MILELAEHIVNSPPRDGVYLTDIVTLVGSRAAGLALPKSDWDLVGIHIMESTECFKHPEFSRDLQVIRKRYLDPNNEVPPGQPGGWASLDSFELWKFISMWLKGAFVSYEILYLRPLATTNSIAKSTESPDLFTLMSNGITNRIGRAAKGNILHDWRKRQSNRKVTTMAYYRANQAIHLLHTGEFLPGAHQLINSTGYGSILTDSYIDPEVRNQPLRSDELTRTTSDMQLLLAELDKALIATRLPDQVPKAIFEEVLRKIVSVRESIFPN